MTVTPSERRESAPVTRQAALSRTRRRHRDLGRHVRPGSERDRAVSALRVPRRALRDLDGRPRPVRVRARCARLPRPGTPPESASAHCSAAAYASADGRARPHDGCEHWLHHRPLRRASRRSLRSPLFGTAGAARSWAGVVACGRRALAPERRTRRIRARERARPRERRVPGIPDHVDGAVCAALRPAGADVPADGRRRSSASPSSPLALGRPRGAAWANGLGRSPRDRRLRRRARLPHRDVGAGADDSARAALVFTLEAPFAALAGVLLADEVPRAGRAGSGCAVMMSGDPRRRARCRAAVLTLADPRCAWIAGWTPSLSALASAFLFGATDRR